MLLGNSKGKNTVLQGDFCELEFGCGCAHVFSTFGTEMEPAECVREGVGVGADMAGGEVNVVER